MKLELNKYSKIASCIQSSIIYPESVVKFKFKFNTRQCWVKFIPTGSERIQRKSDYK